MRYFAEHYCELRYPIADGDRAGLREGQLGATHAVASHFTVSTDRAIVVMPTGSGKTEVLMLVPFLLRAERVLVTTPSRLVRDQLYEDLLTMSRLSELGTVPLDLPAPRVHRVDHRITEVDQWRQLEEYDVVVGTPHVLSPSHTAIPPPPDGLFDVLLVDEAHHSPAATWAALLNALPDTKQVLFTATPFRNDRRQLGGAFVYRYPLAKAREAGIFGEIRFQPVVSGAGEDPDRAIAVAAQAALRADHAAGYPDHRLMVRTDGRRRADSLHCVYSDHTDLRLAVIHSGYSYTHVKRTIDRLRDGELDGILCVDMMGEGFNFPQLKIAAIHAPHKSLAVTLQFIGRFARVGQPPADAGPPEVATFLAVPNEIRFGVDELYREDAEWRDIVTNLADARAEEEAVLQHAHDTFEHDVGDNGLPPSGEDGLELPLEILRPKGHVKVYRVLDEVDLTREIELPKGLVRHDQWTSDDLGTVVLVLREAEPIAWVGDSSIRQPRYSLVVVSHQPETMLIFIHLSDPTIRLYEWFARQYSGWQHRILPLFMLNRVLRGIANLQCSNVGMRSRASGTSRESYRISAGSQAQKAIGNAEARLFNRGHVSVRGEEDGRNVAIGYSSSSVVWCAQSFAIPQLVEWCRTQGAKLVDPAEFSTGTDLDQLRVGRPLNTLPENIIAAQWHEDVFLDEPRVQYPDPDETTRKRPLLDLEVVPGSVDPAEGRLELTVRADDREWPLTFSLDEGIRGAAAGGIVVLRGREEIGLDDYINSHPLSFYLPDFARFCGEELFAAPDDLECFDHDQITTIDWYDRGADIGREEPSGQVALEQPPTGASVHEWLTHHVGQEADAVIYDQRAGEVADIVTLRCSTNQVTVDLYHCKAAGRGRNGRAVPRAQVGDLYEVCGQVAKSIRWSRSFDKLIDRLLARITGGSQLLKVDQSWLSGLKRRRGDTLKWRYWVVQPGLSKRQVSTDILKLFAAADDYIRTFGAEPLQVLCSP